MDYGQRMELIARRLNGFLRQYETPKHLAADEVRMDKIRTIAEAVNSSLPASLTSEALGEIIETSFMRLAKGRSKAQWPEPADFVKVLYSGPAPQSAHQDGSGEVDSAAINAKRILDGKPVGEEWLWGTKCNEMLDRALLTENDLVAHRSGLFLGCRDLHGAPEALAREERHKRLHMRVSADAAKHAPSQQIAQELAKGSAMR